MTAVRGTVEEHTVDVGFKVCLVRNFPLLTAQNYIQPNIYVLNFNMY